jgi:protein-glutamine gamma-glutamyltransferase
MRLPPLFMAAVLLFWGWQTGLLAQGVFLGLCLEAPRLLSVRLRIQPKDFSRLLDLCIMLVLGLALYLYLTPMPEAELLVLVRWLPMPLFPLALAEALDEKRQARFAGLMYTVRRKRSLLARPPIALHVSGIYALVCLFAAGAANTRSDLFYPLMACLALWGLLAARPVRHGKGAWLLMALLCLLLGHVGQWSVHAAQQAVRDWVRHDPLRRSTAIGEVGEVKLSDRIVLRVRTEQPLTEPLLLREATYNYYAKGTWHATGGAFVPVRPEPAGEGGDPSPEDAPRDWPLTQDSPRHGASTGVRSQPGGLEIFQYTPRRRRLLALPLGVTVLRNLVAERVSVSSLGAVLAYSVRGLVSFEVRSAPGKGADEPPTAVDMITPTSRELLQEIVAGLELEGLRDLEKVRRIRDYFLNNFRYTLRLERKRPDLQPLDEFLAHTRAGHCEYFALAAAYTLRMAGIPSRYAVGYAVQEYSPRERLYVARGHHHHAWTLAWVEGRWRDVDATPPVWFVEDAPEQGFFSRLADLRQQLVFAFNQWRWLGGDTTLKRILLWTVAPLLLFLLLRLARQHSIRRLGSGRERPSEEGSFALVEKRLRREGWKRKASEPWGDFLHRAGASSLEPALRLYYRRRFDPRGVSQAEERLLEESVRGWLEER